MYEKNLMFGDDCRTKILAGAKKAQQAVVATLGPQGRNVVIHRKHVQGVEPRRPLVTKDGVTVAKEIKALKDPYEDIGLQMVKEAASRTNDSAGDGTTTATLLAAEMMEEGFKHITSGCNAIHIRRGMQKRMEKVIENLKAMSTPVEEPEMFKAIGTVSSQDEEIGSLVALVVSEVGKEGAITVEAAQSLGIEYTLSEGMQVASGFVSDKFVTERGKPVAIHDDPFILVTDERIVNVQQVLPIIEKIINDSIGDTDGENPPGAERSLVIVADVVEHDALVTLVMNHLKKLGKIAEEEMDGKGFLSLAIRAPFVGDRKRQVLEDIAIATGATLISKSTGRTLENATLEDLGGANRVIATSRATTIIGGHGNEAMIQSRVKLLEQEADSAEGEEKDFLRGRLANIRGKIATIRVGASTEVELKEKQHRVEDAIAAVRAANEEGILPGGGTAFLACMGEENDIELKSEDEKIGSEIVRQTLKKPLWWIAQNAGHEGDAIVKKVEKLMKGHGFNAETGEFGDMIEQRIIDPTKVPRQALENAVSVAGTFITLEVAVVDDLAAKDSE